MKITLFFLLMMIITAFSLKSLDIIDHTEQNNSFLKRTYYKIIAFFEKLFFKEKKELSNNDFEEILDDEPKKLTDEDIQKLINKEYVCQPYNI